MKCIRPTGIVLCILGHYLLLQPLIQVISWIPFIGWLLASFAALAAFTFALIVGSTLALLTIAVAWVFYRPVIGITFLLLAACILSMVFLYDWETPEVTTEEVTTLA